MLTEPDAQRRVETQRRLTFSGIGPRALIRRSWVVLLAMLAVTLVARTIAGQVEPSYRAESVVQVPSGAGPDGPGDAGEARNLATTYAALIPNDEAVARWAALATRTDVIEVFARISVVTDKDTSILHLRFEANSPAGAIAGARALAQAVTARRPIARGVAPGSLQALRTARSATETSSVTSGTAVRLGLILGFALGVVLLIAWQRADPVIDDVETIRSEFETPAIDVDDLSTGSTAIVLERWLDLAGDAPSLVALVPVGARLQAAAADVGDRLAETGRREGLSVYAAPDRDPKALRAAAEAALTLVPTTPPGGPAGGERVADECDVVVLVARPGQALSTVRRAWDVLRHLGLTPHWVLLTRTRGHGPTSRL